MKRLKNLLFLGVFLSITILALTQFYTRQAYQQQLEAGYQRAFRELALHINGIEKELSKVQVVNSPELQAETWANILRLVYSAQANLGQLPLTGLSLSKIEHLIANVQNKTVDYARRSLRELEQTDQTVIVALYEQIQYINGEIQTQLALNERDSNWVSWKSYFQTSMMRSSNVEPGARYPLMHSLVMVEDGMQRFSESDFPSETDGLRGPLPSGDLISQQEAVVIAQQFLKELAGKSELKVVNESSGNLPTFTVQTIGDSQWPITVEITKYGGHVLWMTNGRIVSESVLDKDTLISIAKNFLLERNFTQIELVGANSKQNHLTLDFVPIEQDVLIYPQQIKVQIAEDNGQILGFQGQAYYAFQQNRELAPQLTLDEARRQVKYPENIVEHDLAVIMNPSYEEVLTYQFRVNHEADQFLIHINADQGFEEKISRVEMGQITSW